MKFANFTPPLIEVDLLLLTTQNEGGVSMSILDIFTVVLAVKVADYLYYYIKRR